MGETVRTEEGTQGDGTKEEGTGTGATNEGKIIRNVQRDEKERRKKFNLGV